MYAIVTLKDVGDFVGAKPFVIIGVDMQDQGGNVLILLGVWSWFGREVFIVRASIYFQNPA